MKKLLLFAFIGFAAFLLKSCASIGSPDGGPRDTEVPTLLATVPVNGQTNVRPDKLVLTFSEPIQALNLQRQLLIAPVTDNTYKTRVKDATLEVTFDQPWQDSTTYSLNFRNSIADVTEKNLAKNIVLTFSTGPFLDSGRVSGNVRYLFSAAPPKETNILLYPAQNTAQVTKGRPLYVTQNDSAGNFSFQNIKEGYYYIYALAEANNSLLYDSEKEAIAFTTDSIAVNPTVSDINLVLFYQDKTKPISLSRKSFLNLYELEYNEGLAKVDVRNASQENDAAIQWLVTNSGKTLQLFPSVPEERRWIIEAQDSAGNVKIDTLAIRLAGARAPIRNNSFQVNTGTTVKPGDDIKLLFGVPAKIIDPRGAVTLLLDSTTTVASTDTSQFIFNGNQTQLTLKMPLQGAKEVNISIDTTKIVPFIGLPFLSSTQKIQIADNTNVGSLTVTFATEQKNYFVQLLKDNKIVREIKNLKKITWNDLEPGSYNIRVLVDANGNGSWDNGELLTRTLPEPVILHPASFEIRSNWEIVEENPIQF